MFVIPEVLGHRQRRLAHAETGFPAARFNLSEDHDHVGQHARFLHVVIKFLAFPAPFTDAAEDADAIVMTDHVVDHLRQQNGLAHAGAPRRKGRPFRRVPVAAAHRWPLMPVSNTSDLVERSAREGG